MKPKPRSLSGEPENTQYEKILVPLAPDGSILEGRVNPNIGRSINNVPSHFKVIQQEPAEEVKELTGNKEVNSKMKESVNRAKFNVYTLPVPRPPNWPNHNVFNGKFPKYEGPPVYHKGFSQPLFRALRQDRYYPDYSKYTTSEFIRVGDYWLSYLKKQRSNAERIRMIQEMKNKRKQHQTEKGKEKKPPSIVGTMYHPFFRGYRILVVGHKGSGKTCLIKLLGLGNYSNFQTMTKLGVDGGVTRYQLGEHVVLFESDSLDVKSNSKITSAHQINLVFVVINGEDKEELFRHMQFLKELDKKRKSFVIFVTKMDRIFIEREVDRVNLFQKDFLDKMAISNDFSYQFVTSQPEWMEAREFILECCQFEEIDDVICLPIINYDLEFTELKPFIFFFTQFVVHNMAKALNEKRKRKQLLRKQHELAKSKNEPPPKKKTKEEILNDKINSLSNEIGRLRLKIPCWMVEMEDTIIGHRESLQRDMNLLYQQMKLFQHTDMKNVSIASKDNRCAIITQNKEIQMLRKELQQLRKTVEDLTMNKEREKPKVS